MATPADTRQHKNRATPGARKIMKHQQNKQKKHPSSAHKYITAFPAKNHKTQTRETRTTRTIDSMHRGTTRERWASRSQQKTTTKTRAGGCMGRGGGRWWAHAKLTRAGAGRRGVTPGPHPPLPVRAVPSPHPPPISRHKSKPKPAKKKKGTQGTQNPVTRTPTAQQPNQTQNNTTSEPERPKKP